MKESDDPAPAVPELFTLERGARSREELGVYSNSYDMEMPPPSVRSVPPAVMVTWLVLVLVVVASLMELWDRFWIDDLLSSVSLLHKYPVTSKEKGRRETRKPYKKPAKASRQIFRAVIF